MVLVPVCGKYSWLLLSTLCGILGLLDFPTLPLPTFVFILTLYYGFGEHMLASLMRKSYVSCNKEWQVIQGCVFVLQTKIYTSGTTQCQWSTDRRSRL